LPVLRRGGGALRGPWRRPAPDVHRGLRRVLPPPRRARRAGRRARRGSRLARAGGV